MLWTLAVHSRGRTCCPHYITGKLRLGEVQQLVQDHKPGGRGSQHWGCTCKWSKSSQCPKGGGGERPGQGEQLLRDKASPRSRGGQPPTTALGCGPEPSRGGEGQARLGGGHRHPHCSPVTCRSACATACILKSCCGQGPERLSQGSAHRPIPAPKSASPQALFSLGGGGKR